MFNYDSKPNYLRNLRF